MDTNKTRTVLPFGRDLITNTVQYPAMFTHELGIENLYVQEPPQTFVQVLVLHEINEYDSIDKLYDMNIPFVAILLSGKIDNPNEGDDMVKRVMHIMKQRHDMIEEWIKLDAKYVNRSLDFLKTSDTLFATIVQQIVNGTIASLSIHWQSLLKKQIEFLRDASNRFLKIKQEGGEVVQPSTHSKKFKPIQTFDLHANSSMIPVDSDATLEPPKQAEAEIDLETELGKLTDPLSEFIAIALGSYGSQLRRGYVSMPVISKNYTTQARVDEYLNKTSAVVRTSLRATETDLTPHTLHCHGKPWSLLAVLQRPRSSMFTLCARLMGQHMRMSELNSVTRSHLTLHSTTEHRRAVNDLIKRILDLIYTGNELCT